MNLIGVWTMTGIKKGDLVWVCANAKHLVRNEEIAAKAIVLTTIPEDWYRICMTWGEKSKIFDIPGHMLKKIDEGLKANEGW